MKTAADFNTLTRRGLRKDMGNEAFFIFARRILKKVIKRKFYIQCVLNLTQYYDASSDNRQKFGYIIDGIIEILEDDNVNINVGCRIDDLIIKEREFNVFEFCMRCHVLY